MEMTIDEAISNLSMYSVDEYGNAYSGTWYKGIAEDMENSFELAIEIMSKYQKIKEIVKNNNGLLDGTLEHAKAFIKICEVIEDGNDD